MFRANRFARLQRASNCIECQDGPAQVQGHTIFCGYTEFRLARMNVAKNRCFRGNGRMVQQARILGLARADSSRHQRRNVSQESDFILAEDEKLVSRYFFVLARAII